MIQKYSAIKGVPIGHYYLVQILAFADFDVAQEEKIRYTSDNMHELIEFCKEKNYHISFYNPHPTGWNEYYIDGPRNE